MNKEERQLGLDPSKYTKKPFNPQDSFGYSKNTGSSPLFKVVEDMRPMSLESEQMEAMGQYLPTPDQSQEERAMQKQKMFEAMSQAKDTDFQAIDREYFAKPESQALIKQLNLDYDLERGTPILQEDDEARLRSNPPGDERTQLLWKLMQE